MSLTVFLGTHEPAWLPRMTVPLFVSRRRLARRKSLPRAAGAWALDSGGFTELSMFGKWETTPEKYAAEARRYADEVGGLQWASIQDWMCEPFMLQRTGSTVQQHQERTIDNYARLLELAPELPWCPVLQGWTPGDYHDHLEQYARRGFDLRDNAIVGLGSVCRRQHTSRVEHLALELRDAGLKLHGFGFKVKGLARVSDVLTSSDSMAWSLNARKNPPLPECSHQSCANCSAWALQWYESLQSKLDGASRAHQMELFIGEGH